MALTFQIILDFDTETIKWALNKLYWIVIAKSFFKTYNKATLFKFI